MYNLWASITGATFVPYKSAAQRGYFHANRAKLEAQGVNVAEWDAASKSKALPARMSVREAARHVVKRRKKRNG